MNCLIYLYNHYINVNRIDKPTILTTMMAFVTPFLRIVFDALLDLQVNLCQLYFEAIVRCSIYQSWLHTPEYNYGFGGLQNNGESTGQLDQLYAVR